MRVAFSSIASKTGSSSPGDELMTCSTSAVAVCCSSDCRNSLSSRVFSMAMTAWAAKFLHQIDLLVGEGLHFLAIDADGADQFALLEHRHADHTRSRLRQAELRRIALPSGIFGGDVGDVNHVSLSATTQTESRLPERDHGIVAATTRRYSGGAPCIAHDPKVLAVVDSYRMPNSRIANPHRVLQHGMRRPVPTRRATS